MKALALIVVMLFSYSALACRIDFHSVGDQTKKEFVASSKLDPASIKVQKLLHYKEVWSENRVSSCPDVIVFYYSFQTKKEKNCTYLTKYRMGIAREEINPFVVLDADCDY